MIKGSAIEKLVVSIIGNGWNGGFLLEGLFFEKLLVMAAEMMGFEVSCFFIDSSFVFFFLFLVELLI